MRASLYTLLLSQLLYYLTGCENFLSEPSTQITEDFTGQIDTVFDIDGNTYRTVGIGSQIWMAQNLSTTRLNDGTIIPEIKLDSIWDYYSNMAFCWYKNDTIYNSKIYGALYNYYTIKTGILCPLGWHVPEDSEWKILEDYLGGSQKAGGKLKDYFTPYWADPNVCIANNYGFLALPGGKRSHILGKFRDLTYLGNWWTSTSKNDFISYSRTIYNSRTQISRLELSRGDGLSVRCIKD